MYREERADLLYFIRSCFYLLVLYSINIFAKSHSCGKNQRDIFIGKLIIISI